jgi:acyl-lipid omega-6 desaturase (Delta-12 desaturase)
MTTEDPILLTDENNLDFPNQETVMTHISNYCHAKWEPALLELGTTFLFFWIALQFSNILLAPLFGLVFVRIFIVFHDMAHNSFFPSKIANYVGALVLGTMVFTPVSFWTRGHNYHHKNSNKLNHPQHAQTASWETSKYLAASPLKRKLYRWVYGKYTLFTINPVIYFLGIHRFVSGLIETIAMGTYIWFLYNYLSGWQYLYFLASIWIAGIYGFLLFHAQHTFDGVYRAYGIEDFKKIKESNPDAEIEQWSYFMNGMLGSSFLQVPWPLSIFTCNIEYHHIHHLNSKVPFYHLAVCHRTGEHLFKNVPRVTLMQVFGTLHYSLYNVAEKRFQDVYEIVDQEPTEHQTVDVAN